MVRRNAETKERGRARGIGGRGGGGEWMGVRGIAVCNHCYKSHKISTKNNIKLKSAVMTKFENNGLIAPECKIMLNKISKQSCTCYSIVIYK